MYHVNIDMIAVSRADGSMEPLRFQFTDRKALNHRVRIDEILNRRELKHVETVGYVFLCCGFLEEELCLFELQYTVRTHRWTLFSVTPTTKRMTGMIHA